MPYDNVQCCIKMENIEWINSLRCLMPTREEVAFMLKHLVFPNSPSIIINLLSSYLLLFAVNKWKKKRVYSETYPKTKFKSRKYHLSYWKQKGMANQIPVKVRNCKYGMSLHSSLVKCHIYDLPKRECTKKKGLNQCFQYLTGIAGRKIYKASLFPLIKQQKQKERGIDSKYPFLKNTLQ